MATQKRTKTTKPSPEPLSFWDENPLHLRAFELRFAGHSWVGIGRKLDTDRKTARAWADRPEWRERWEERIREFASEAEEANAAALRELQKDSPRFVRQLRNLALKPSGKSGKTQLGATRDALDRLGVRVVEKNGGLALVMRELFGAARGHLFGSVQGLTAEAMGLAGEAQGET